MKPLSWILPSTFQPDKISCLENGRSALIVSGLEQVQMLVFKDIQTALNDHSSQPDKNNTIKIHSSIVKIVNSKYKTYCLHENGKVSEFLSQKEIKELQGIVACKDLLVTSNGLTVLEKESEKNLLVTYHSSTSSKQERHEFDCGQSLNDEVYSLYVTHVSAVNVKTLTGILGVDMYNHKEKQIVMFSVGSNIFWIEPEGDEYEIRTLRSCSSKVLRFWLSQDTESLNILLSSGVLEVLYLCPAVNLLTFKRFYLTDDLWSFELIFDTKIVFSNCFEVTLIEIKKCKEGIVFIRKSLPLAGTIAVSYLKKINSVICVTENRIFYKLDFSCEQLADEQKFLEVNDDFIIAAKQIQKKLEKEIRLCSRAHKELKECETKKIMLKKLLSKSDVLQFQLCHSINIPSDLEKIKILEPTLLLSQKCIYTTISVPLLELKQMLNANFHYIFIEIKEKLKPKNDMFQSSTTTKVIPVNSLHSMDETLKLLLITKSSSNILMPDINIYLECMIDMCSDKLLIKIPIKIKQAPIETLVNVTPYIQKDCSSNSLQPENLTEIIQKIVKINCIEYDFEFNCLEKFYLETDENYLSFKFKLVENFDPASIVNNIHTRPDKNDVNLNVLGNMIFLHFDLENQELTIKGNNPGALMIAKKFIYNKIYRDSITTFNMEAECKNKLKGFNVELKNPNLDLEIVEYYQKIRNIPIEFNVGDL